MVRRGVTGALHMNSSAEHATTEALAGSPAPDAVRRLCLRWLDAAAAASQRVMAGSDSEALHDFRVALRRLRTGMRAHWSLLAGDVGKQQRRRITELARATGAARDAEVQLRFVQECAERSAVHVEPFLARLQARAEATREDVLVEVLPRFGQKAPLLRELLSWYHLPVRVGEPPVSPTFAEHVGALVPDHAQALTSALATIGGADDDAHIHAARIAGKRLRYLLEPLAGEVAGVAELLVRLQNLQDVLGDLHDRHVFAALLRAGEVGADQHDRAALEALARLAHADVHVLFARFVAGWDAGGRAAFAASLASLASSLAKSEDVEIERKYLLAAAPAEAMAAPFVDIEQGWIPGRRVLERLRRSRDAAGERLTRTVKLGAGVRRIEIEEDVAPDLFARMWPLTAGRRLRKRRHRVPVGDLVWEIDVFADRDLVLAELELRQVDQEVDLPAWLAPLVVREVTDEPAYVNVNLAC